MNYIKILCQCCGNPKDIVKGEYNRKLRLGTKFYCSKKCSYEDNKHLLIEGSIEYSKSEKGIKHLNNIRPIRPAEPFNYFLRIKTRRTKQEFKISIEYLKELWAKQNGLCAISNLPLELPHGVEGFSTVKPFNGASLDRINSNYGYIEGNVQFVCMGINFMKNDWNQDYIKDWILAMSKSVLDKYKEVLDNNKVIEV
jgi:hypothetical protein